MDVATLWDVIGRVIGIAFLLFMIALLVFPGRREIDDLVETVREPEREPEEQQGSELHDEAASRQHQIGHLRTRYGEHS